MHKYIAVVNPRMEEDEISRLISKGIAGALFQISHQNYPVAARLIELVKTLAKKHNRPVSIIQDVSDMTDPLDMQFGLRSGVDWVATDKSEHVKLARGLDKLAGVIFKGRNLPKGVRVDSIMADGFVDPDAEVIGKSGAHIKHLITEHPNQAQLDAILHFTDHSGSSAIVVTDLGLARALSARNAKHKIIFAPEDHRLASRGAIYKNVHPVFMGSDLLSTIKHHNLSKKGQRVVDATDGKHITIHLVP